MIYGGGRSHRRTALWLDSLISREDTGNFTASDPFVANDIPKYGGKLPNIVRFP
jgi:hypothetical protein